MRRTALVLGSFLLLCPALDRNVLAASITEIGADGTAGVDGVSSPPAAESTHGGNGGEGESASASATANSNSSNEATATGGNGGMGGDGGENTPLLWYSRFGGAGGAGGAAQATAETLVDGSAGSATAQANGGSGGVGGAGAPAIGFSGGGGPGGSGGAADALSSVQNDGGTSTSTATAIGGAGGLGGPSGAAGIPGPPFGSSGPGGNASAAATATSLGDASATALAVAGSSDSAFFQTGVAVANASATSDSGNAFASAEARDGRFNGPVTPIAQAFAPQGDATAISRVIGSDGLEGASAAAYDGPSGGASGRLTLIQEAIGGRNLSAAHQSHLVTTLSYLSAVNSYGGALEGHSRATGGPRGAIANATITARSLSGAPVDAYALATGGQATNAGIIELGGRAHASSSVLGPLDASLAGTATGASWNAGLMGARSALRLTGATELTAADAYLSVSGAPFTGITAPIDEVSMSVTSAASANRAAPEVDLSAIAARTGQAQVFMRPSQSDVDAWTSGNPHAAAALAGGDQVLALGSLAISGDSRADFNYGGSFALSLDLAEPGFHVVELAFLDPTSVGSFDALHLAFRSNGILLLEQTFSSPSELLAGLDDVVLPVLYGDLVPTVLEVAFDVTLLEGAVTSGLAFDLAVLNRVPEPGASLLACAGVLGSLVLRAIRRPASR